jgi:membrane protein
VACVGKDGRVRRRWQDWIDWGSRLGADYTRNRASLAAGGLAYFVALSLAPAALAVGTLAGLFLEPAEVRAALDALVARAPEGAGDLQPLVDALVGVVESASASAFTITTVVSALIAIYAASKVVFGLRMAMNTVFGVTETRSGLIERAVATAITLVGLVLMVAVVILLTFVPRVLEWLGATGRTTSTGNWLLDWLVVIVLVFVSVRWILRHAPNEGERVPWSSLGAIVATLGIFGVTVGVGVYARFSSSLGAAVLLFGTAVVILLWLYLCFVSLLWGAIIEADRQRGVQRMVSTSGVRTRTTEGDQPRTP